MIAVDSVVDQLKTMSRQVTTPEEIAQVCWIETLVTVKLGHVCKTYMECVQGDKQFLKCFFEILQVLVKVYLLDKWL